MKRLLHTIHLVLLSSLAVVAQDDLLEPVWSSEVTAKYLARLAQSSEFSSNTSEFGQVDSYVLPVIGFEEGFASAEPSSRLSDAFIGTFDAPAPIANLSSDKSWWPTCAAEVPEPEVARDDTGTWYFGTYDFGCLQVTIEGDLHRSVSVSEELTDEVADKASAQTSLIDETGVSEEVLSVTETVHMFGVPYNVTLDCTDESKRLCQNKADRSALISRLTIRAGRPQ